MAAERPAAPAPAEPAAANPAANPPKEVRWSGRTRGGRFGNWFFVQVVRWLGVKWAYAWLVFVAAYFTVAGGPSRRASLDFLGRVFGPISFWKRPWLVYRHFFAAGVTLLDRLAVIMGNARMEYRMEGEEQFLEYLRQGRGIILVGAHLGNWEIGGHLLGRLGKPVNVVVLEKEEARVRAMFEQALADRQFRLLSTDDHPLRSIPIIAALKRGEIVALHGDRSFGGSDLVVPFLGGKARFPVGPFKLAAASGAPLFQVFVVRERLGHYLFFTHPPELLGREVLRAPDEALRPQVTAYAQRLEAAARKYPWQWANFYPYWEESA